jgi:hypothetical protein
MDPNTIRKIVDAFFAISGAGPGDITVDYGDDDLDD